MPSFDTVSEVDNHEITNAIDQSKRELTTRWDFKNVEADISYDGTQITLAAEQEFQLEQMKEILAMSFSKRGIDVRVLEDTGESKAGKQVKKHLSIKQGIDQPTAKKLVKLVKENKMKVQAAIQGDKVRVTGKKRDDLQAAMKLFKEAEIETPLQFNNFRD